MSVSDVFLEAEFKDTGLFEIIAGVCYKQFGTNSIMIRYDMIYI